MSKFLNAANEMIRLQSATQVPRAGFARMCEDANRERINSVTNEQLAALYNAATRQNAYKATCGISEDMAEELRQAVETIDRNLTREPKTLAELMGCHAEENAWTGTSTIMMPNGGCWADRSVLAGYLRDILKNTAHLGHIRREVVTSCGIVICYRYSL